MTSVCFKILDKLIATDKIIDYIYEACWDYSHKKRKDSLETRSKRAVLPAYIENQDILESILLCLLSKYKQTKKPGC